MVELKTQRFIIFITIKLAKAMEIRFVLTDGSS